ncbi:hypothetical protein LCGC14_1095060 [marine sediment metagenome]|uniref:Uncharacterized protein n=1 Tax=marine sediment metagenome TaxID=412755 RepID=A0A0F9QH70_9ZZZZ
MKEPVHATVDGVNYTFEMLEATRSWKLVLRLAKMLGPSLGHLADALLSGGEGVSKEVSGKELINRLMAFDFSGDFVGSAIEALVDHMGEAEVEYVINELKSKTRVNDTQPLSQVFDLHFQGEPWKIINWMRHALTAQMGPSLGGLGNAAGQAANLENPPAPAKAV